jgi:hypothetical protein
MVRMLSNGNVLDVTCESKLHVLPSTSSVPGIIRHANVRDRIWNALDALALSARHHASGFVLFQGCDDEFIGPVTFGFTTHDANGTLLGKVNTLEFEDSNAWELPNGYMVLHNDSTCSVWDVKMCTRVCQWDADDATVLAHTADSHLVCVSYPAAVERTSDRDVEKPPGAEMDDDDARQLDDDDGALALAWPCGDCMANDCVLKHGGVEAGKYPRYTSWLINTYYPQRHAQSSPHAPSATLRTSRARSLTHAAADDGGYRTVHQRCHITIRMLHGHITSTLAVDGFINALVCTTNGILVYVLSSGAICSVDLHRPPTAPVQWLTPPKTALTQHYIDPWPIAVLSNNEQVVVGGDNEQLHILDLATRRVRTVRALGNVVTVVALHDERLAYVWEREVHNGHTVRGIRVLA